MTGANDNQNGRLELPPSLKEELRRAVTPPEGVPGEIDQAIRNRARRHFARLARGRQIRRWLPRVAAVAAVLVVAFLLSYTPQSSHFAGRLQSSRDSFSLRQKHGRASEQSLTSPGQAGRQEAIDRITTKQAKGPADIDGSGRVDILDAFALARHLKRGRLVEADLDINQDGRLDRVDVDAVAMAAVRLPVRQGVL